MASLATTYRPTKFEDVVGQERVKAILQNQIETGEFKNAYLFTGGARRGKPPFGRRAVKGLFAAVVARV